jgi:hypothetical protein
MEVRCGYSICTPGTSEQLLCTILVRRITLISSSLGLQKSREIFVSHTDPNIVLFLNFILLPLKLYEKT